MNLTLTSAFRRHKGKMLPVFVFLFAVCFGLLTILVVMQDRTIDVQSDLIHLLTKEARRLSTVAATQQQFPATKNSTRSGSCVQVPSSQASSVETPQVLSKHASEIPSSQEKRETKPGRRQHSFSKRSPFRPPSELTDPSDMRRSLVSI
jgi:Tfp pilus assembly protein PilN